MSAPARQVLLKLYKISSLKKNLQAVLVERYIIRAICKADISGRSIINFVCRVLCLIVIIVRNIAQAPPRRPVRSNVFSEILRLLLLAASLSYTVITILKTEIAAKNAIIYFIKITT